jgi:hypothetical protein
LINGQLVRPVATPEFETNQRHNLSAEIAMDFNHAGVSPRVDRALRKESFMLGSVKQGSGHSGTILLVQFCT